MTLHLVHRREEESLYVRVHSRSASLSALDKATSGAIFFNNHLTSLSIDETTSVHKGKHDAYHLSKHAIISTGLGQTMRSLSTQSEYRWHKYERC